VRQWRGHTHAVLVREDGFEYEEQRYQSLTVIAERRTSRTKPSCRQHARANASSGDAGDDLIEVALSRWRGARRRVRLANSRPNLRPHCRIVSCVTEMPRATGISSTVRRLNENRKYSHTADLMISAG
jgi:Protein of unknown function (DUF2924)